MFSRYMPSREPEASIIGTISARAAAKPSIGDVVGAYTEETFFGEGSLAQDITAGNIQKQDAKGVAISQDDYKASESYRDGIKWYEGMTSKSAETLAATQDDRKERQNIIERASGLQTTLGFGAALTTGIFEPKNVGSGAVVALATAGLGKAIPTIGRLTRVNTVRAAAGRGVIEGVAGAAITEPSNLESSRIVQGDYTLADTMLNFGLSAVLGGGFGAAAKGLELRGRGKKLDAIKGYRAERAELAIQEFDTALGQTMQGQSVEVGAVKQVSDAERVPQLTTLSQERLDSFPDIMPVGKNKFEARFNDENGLLAGAVGIGKNPNEAARNLIIQYRNPNAIAKTQIDENLVSDILESNKLKTEIKKITSPEYFQAQLEAKKVPLGILQGLEERVAEIEAKRATERQNITGKKLEKKYKLFDEETDKQLAPFKAELESFRKLNINEPLADIAQGIKLRKQELRSKLDGLDKNIKQVQTKNAAQSTEYKKFQASLAKPDNSTAYDSVPSKQMEADLEQAKLPDDKIVTDNLENIQQELTELLQQKQLAPDEVKRLETLNKIDNEVDVFDNIYSNLKNCLLR